MTIDTDLFNSNSTVRVEVVTLSGTNTYDVEEGTTVGAFKASNGLQGYKVISGDNVVLKDSDVLEQDIQLIISSPKKNG